MKHVSGVEHVAAKGYIESRPTIQSQSVFRVLKRGRNLGRLQQREIATKREGDTKSSDPILERWVLCRALDYSNHHHEKEEA